MLVYEGTIITCDQAGTVARYLVADKERIVFVGDILPDAYAGCEVIRLGEGALIPAFVDSHIHFAGFSTFHAGLNVMDAASNADILSMLKEHVRTAREKIIVGFGASPYSVSEGRLVTREELDSVCPDKPVYIVKYDGHACVVNSALLAIVKDKVAPLRGYHPDTGEMNQEAFFAVSDHVTGAISPITLVKNMQKAADFLLTRGIGMIHSVSGVGFPRDMDVDLERWFGRGLTSGLQYRVFFQTMDLKKVAKRKLPRVGGCFATALDGCFGSKDAAMLEPYEGTDDRGVLFYTDDEVFDFCREANRAGLQIQLHAIGDRAFDQATRAFKAALDDSPRTDHRHTIIHACLPTQEGIDICARYGIVLAMQSAFIAWPQEPGSYLSAILGERADRLNPLRTLADKGIVMSLGSDGPCTTPDPITWIHKACNHDTPNESLTVMEALRCATYWGYWGSFDEGERGSLETGKMADMVVLSENPLAIQKEQLKDIRVSSLILQGEPRFEAVEGLVHPDEGAVLSHMLRGFLSQSAI